MNTHAHTYALDTQVTTPGALFDAPYGTVATCPDGYTYRTVGAPTGSYLLLYSPELETQVELHRHHLIDPAETFATGPVTITTAAPEPGVFWSHTAQEWREKAAQCHRARAESWERSDTDGFMTQYANQEMASRYEDAARVAEMDGTVVRRALFDLDGNHRPARLVETQYGQSWGLWPAGKVAGRFESWFNESRARDEAVARRNNARKGLYIGRVRVRAILDASKIVWPTEELVEIVDNGVDPVVYGEEE